MKAQAQILFGGTWVKKNHSLHGSTEVVNEHLSLSDQLRRPANYLWDSNLFHLSTKRRWISIIKLLQFAIVPLDKFRLQKAFHQDAI